MSMPHPLPISFREEALSLRQEIINTPKWRRCSLPRFGNSNSNSNSSSNESKRKNSRSNGRRKRKQDQISNPNSPSDPEPPSGAEESPSKKSRILPLAELQTEKGLRIGVNPEDLPGTSNFRQQHHRHQHDHPSLSASLHPSPAAAAGKAVRKSPSAVAGSEHSDADDSTTSIDGLDSLPGSPDRLLREQTEEEEKSAAAAEAAMMVVDDDDGDTEDDDEEESSDEDISDETLWARHDYCMWEMRYQNARALLLSSRKARRLRQQNSKSNGGTPRGVGRPPNSGRRRRGRSSSTTSSSASCVADHPSVSPLTLPSPDPGTSIPSLDASAASQMLPVNSTSASPKSSPSSPKSSSKSSSKSSASFSTPGPSVRSKEELRTDDEIDPLLVRPLGRDKYLLEYLKDYEPNPIPEHVLETVRFNYTPSDSAAASPWTRPRLPIRYLGPKPIPRVQPLPPSHLPSDHHAHHHHSHHHPGGREGMEARTTPAAERGFASVEAPSSLVEPAARKDFQRRKHLLLQLLHLQRSKALKASREDHLRQRLRLAAELKSRKKAAAEIVKKELFLQQQQQRQEQQQEQQEREAAQETEETEGESVKLEQQQSITHEDGGDPSPQPSSAASLSSPSSSSSSSDASSTTTAAAASGSTSSATTDGNVNTAPSAPPALRRPRIVSVAAVSASASSASSSSASSISGTSSSTVLKLELHFIPSKMESGNDGSRRGNSSSSSSRRRRRDSVPLDKAAGHHHHQTAIAVQQ